MALRQLPSPSFRSRLRLFFVIIVIVPMVAVALVLFRIVGRSEQSQVDAGLAVGQNVVQTLYDEERRRADPVTGRIGRDEELGRAIQEQDSDAIERRLRELADEEGAARVVLRLDGEGEFVAGNVPAVAGARRPLESADGRPVGELNVSVTDGREFAERASGALGMEVALTSDGQMLAGTLPDLPAGELPEEGPVTVGDDEFRARSFPLAGFDGTQLTAGLLEAADEFSLTSGETLLVVIVMAGFLLLAVAFALMVSRTLHTEIQRLLVAAQRLGGGDFSVTVPAEGSDEFAQLGKEFNSMARQLESRLEELQRERARLEEAIRRVGESFAKGLDRVGLLEIVVQTAVDGVGAACGRATMRRGTDEPLREVARTGDPAPYQRALLAAEAAVKDAGQVAEIQLGGASALAAPLGSTEEGELGQVVGLVSVARGDRPFTQGERELFSYLTNQASVSVENVDLHETVQKQAVTDELTGLFNHRRFQEVMTAEVERARRYNQEMGLIMLDIDNFKGVNDAHGHMQGDVVLREVARVLRQSSREIDEPARYGGEEMAVALPGTDIEGAYQFAERVRRRIEALELPLGDGNGTLKVTASFGAASLATAGEADKDALVAAADAALYRAKRSGKNRTERAE
jgi:diguanylate cyclase (GGDEF)-like protein